MGGCVKEEPGLVITRDAYKHDLTSAIDYWSKRWRKHAPSLSLSSLQRIKQTSLQGIRENPTPSPLYSYLQRPADYWKWFGSSLVMMSTSEKATWQPANVLKCFNFLLKVTASRKYKWTKNSPTHTDLNTFLYMDSKYPTSFPKTNLILHGEVFVCTYGGNNRHLTPVCESVSFTMVTSWQQRHDGIDVWEGNICNESSCVVSTHPLPPPRALMLSIHTSNKQHVQETQETVNCLLPVWFNSKKNVFFTYIIKAGKKGSRTRTSVKMSKIQTQMRFVFYWKQRCTF